MEISKAIVEGEMEKIIELINESLEGGTNAERILGEMIEGMENVGDKFERKEYYVPETLLSAHTMKLGLEILRPYLNNSNVNNSGTVVIGAVESDIHDIGLNLVAMFLEASGFEIHNLGRDVPTERFIEKSREVHPNIVALSAMMSTTALRLKGVIEEFKKNGLSDGVFFVVGGAALSGELAYEIGADSYASDAKQAVRVFEKLMKEDK